MIARLTTFDYFNPLPRKEGDVFDRAAGIYGRDFNPLPRKEGDDGIRGVGVALWLISIHSLVKRETPLEVSSGKLESDFNPLPRKEGDSFLLADTVHQF